MSLSVGSERVLVVGGVEKRLITGEVRHVTEYRAGR